MYVLNYERLIKPKLGLNEKEQMMWRKAIERFTSFERGESVKKSG